VYADSRGIGQLAQIRASRAPHPAAAVVTFFLAAFDFAGAAEVAVVAAGVDGAPAGGVVAVVGAGASDAATNCGGTGSDPRWANAAAPTETSATAVAAAADEMIHVLRRLLTGRG
jgi:hypothetical protein